MSKRILLVAVGLLLFVLGSASCSPETVSARYEYFDTPQGHSEDLRLEFDWAEVHRLIPYDSIEYIQRDCSGQGESCPIEFRMRLRKSGTGEYESRDDSLKYVMVDANGEGLYRYGRFVAFIQDRRIIQRYPGYASSYPPSGSYELRVWSARDGESLMSGSTFRDGPTDLWILRLAFEGFATRPGWTPVTK